MHGSIVSQAANPTHIAHQTPAKNVNMVFDSADLDRWAVEIVASASEIRVEAVAQIADGEKAHAVLRREHDVQINLGDGLWQWWFPL
jgi:hypothetical protein